ncbi:Meiotic nuclear division protein 1 [Actinomortierella wolfii]|nr:Meiotic nuclear division protein 1 [Actinomortierella wolfii]
MFFSVLLLLIHEPPQSKKGLSIAEKRTKMLEIFHESSVKDVLQSLVDDGLVITEKVGTINLYWAFPSAAQQSKTAKIQSLQHEIQRLEQSNALLSSKIDEAMAQRQDSSDRQAWVEQLAAEEAISKELEQQLKQYSDCDPALLKAQAKYSQIAKDAANRWTENIFILQSYCVNKFNVDRQELNRNFGIDDEMDTIP